MKHGILLLSLAVLLGMASVARAQLVGPAGGSASSISSALGTKPLGVAIPPFALYYGNGESGAFSDSTQNLNGGDWNYSGNCTLSVGHTITLSATNSLGRYVIRCTGNINIAGTITGTGQGGNSGQKGLCGGSGGGGGGATGGAGAAAPNIDDQSVNIVWAAGGTGGGTTPAVGGNGNTIAQQFLNTFLSTPYNSNGVVSFGGTNGGTGGNTGGSGGAGGPLLMLIAGGTVTVSGTVTANGANGSNGSTTVGGGGGGGGGCLIESGTTVTNSGTVTANGGSPGTGTSSAANGGTGGAGVVITYTHS